MKYYSDEIVKQIIKDTMRYTMTISQSVPMSAEHYPSIEIPDKHGRLIDAVALKGSIEGRILAGQDVNVFSEIDNATTVLEAST